jgi:hypothetical protein
MKQAGKPRSLEELQRKSERKRSRTKPAQKRLRRSCGTQAPSLNLLGIESPRPLLVSPRHSRHSQLFHYFVNASNSCSFLNRISIRSRAPLLCVVRTPLGFHHSLSGIVGIK